MSECKGLFGRLFGHRYEAAYNFFPPTMGSFKSDDADVAKVMVEGLTRREVAGVFCTRCGDRRFA